MQLQTLLPRSTFHYQTALLCNFNQLWSARLQHVVCPERGTKYLENLPNHSWSLNKNPSYLSALHFNGGPELISSRILWVQRFFSELAWRLTWQGLREAEHTVPVHFSEHTAPPLWCWWSRAPAVGRSGEQRRPVARVQVAGDPLHPRTDTHSPAGCPL